MKNFFKPKYIIALSAIIIVFSVVFNITAHKISVHHLKPEEPFILTLNTLPEGEYELAYYVACSSSLSSAPSMKFTLKDSRSDGSEIIFEERSYTVAKGFGVSRFKVDGGSNVTANFTALNQNGASTWAGIGTVYVTSASTTEVLYAPDSFGKLPAIKSMAQSAETNQSVRLSDFAMLEGFSVNGSVLELTVKCTERTAADYELGFKISSGNINVLLPEGEAFRYYGLTPKTSEWQQGQSYTQTIDLKLMPGVYTLETLLSSFPPGTAGNTKYYRIMNSQERIPLGNIIIGG